MLVCWSVGGGVGTSVVVAGLATVARRTHDEALVVDLAGDQPLLWGAPEPSGPGLSAWLDAGPDVPPDALARLAVEVGPGISVMPRGQGQLSIDRAAALRDALALDVRPVIVDAGLLASATVAHVLATAAQPSLLVARACPLTLRRLALLPADPTGVVVVRDRRRGVTWQEVATAASAPVVAELEIDPAVALAVDAGLDQRSFPRSFLRVLETLR